MKTTLQFILADDDEDDRYFFTEIMHAVDPGIQVKTFDDGHTLINYINSSENPPPPDIIFLDINMPLKEGLKSLKEIRANEIYCKVPIFMFTISTKQYDVETSYDCGANLYIRKPFSLAEGILTMTKIVNDFKKDGVQKLPKDRYFIE